MRTKGTTHTHTTREATELDPSASLWIALRTGDEDQRIAAREQILHEYVSLVRLAARQLSRMLSEPVGSDQLFGSGTLGLIRAIDMYDPARGVAFPTFAYQHIRGAILDELRRSDTIPRSIRAKMRKLMAARITLQQSLGREVNDQEIVDYLGISAEMLREWTAAFANLNEAILEIPIHEIDTDEDVDFNEFIADDSVETADEVITQEQQVAIVRDLIQTLKPTERTVLSLYYFENLTMSQISTMMEITEGRVSQLRVNAIRHIQAALSARRQYVA